MCDRPDQMFDSQIQMEAENYDDEAFDFADASMRDVPDVVQPYHVLNMGQVLRMQKISIEEVRSYFNTNENVARRLMMKHRWNKERLMNDFFESGLGELMKRSRVEIDNCVVGQNEPCPVCSELDDLKFSTNGCGHRSCNDCWTYHVAVQINEGKSRDLVCMECNTFITSDLLYGLGLPSTIINQYEKAMLDSYVDDNPYVKWCTACPLAIELNCGESKNLDCECDCGELFCFNCGEASHCPVPCKSASKWNKRCGNEAETAIYIASTCKKCPTCNKILQKKNGCNHITCPCGQHLCWLCGEATGLHHNMVSIEGHVCKKFEPNAAAEPSADEMLRFVHYVNRFNIHMDSYKTAKATEARLIIEGEYRLLGLKQLLRMRIFMAWTYVYAFYAEINGTVQAIFEGMQSKLQTALERLSHLTELPCEQLTEDVRAEVLGQSRITHQLAVNLWGYVAGEFTQNAYFPIRCVVKGLGVSRVVLDEVNVRRKKLKS